MGYLPKPSPGASAVSVSTYPREQNRPGRHILFYIPSYRSTRNNHALLVKAYWRNPIWSRWLGYRRGFGNASLKRMMSRHHSDYHIDRHSRCHIRGSPRYVETFVVDKSRLGKPADGFPSYIQIRRRAPHHPHDWDWPGELCQGISSQENNQTCLLTSSYQSVVAGEVLYGPAIGAVKISTLLLFARIFPGRKLRRGLWAIGLFVSTYTALMVIIGIFHCSPIKGAWDPTVEAKCIQIRLFYMVMAGMNVLTDIMLLCAPMPELWKLQMRWAAKLQLIGIFSIGSMFVTLSSDLDLIEGPADPVLLAHSVTVISIYRIPRLQSISLIDPAWDDIDPSIWSVAEVSVAILGASAIT